MRVLVDTCVWSAAIRRGGGVAEPCRSELERLIRGGAVEMIGPIRQEILSGVRDAEQFERLRSRLEVFQDLEILPEDYVMAARFYNQCRAKGVQGSGTDFLICSVAARHRLAVFTTDGDFEHYRKILPIQLHRPGIG